MVRIHLPPALSHVRTCNRRPSADEEHVKAIDDIMTGRHANA